MSDTSVIVNTAPWDLFLTKLKEAGVRVQVTKRGGHPYLIRELHGRPPLHAPLPKDYMEPGSIVGCLVFDTICRSLELKPTEHFKGWYYML